MNKFLESVKKLRLKRKKEAHERMKKMLKDGKPDYSLKMDELNRKKAKKIVKTFA